MKFDLLVQSIAEVHRETQARAVKAVNVGLTLRNWLIGGLITHYNLRGEDRAAYGEKVVDMLSQRLRESGMPHAHRRDLYRYADFFRTYPQIVESATPQSVGFPKIVASLLPQSPCDPIRTVEGRRRVNSGAFRGWKMGNW